MFRYLHELIFESTPARFESRYSLLESVERLEKKIESPILNYNEHAEGEVSIQFVRICRAIPNSNNNLKPIFTGSFVKEQGKVFLEGNFALPADTRRTLVVMFAVLSCVIGAMLAGVLWGDISLGALVFPVVFALVLVMSISWGRVIGRDDVLWISSLIRKTIER